jgi:hypothetical protein
MAHNTNKKYFKWHLGWGPRSEKEESYRYTNTSVVDLYADPNVFGHPGNGTGSGTFHQQSEK